MILLFISNINKLRKVMSSSQKVNSNSSFNNFKDYVIQNKWVAVALLATSIAIASITIICTSLFVTHHLFIQGLNPTLLILPATLAAIGLSISIALFIKNGRSPLHRALQVDDSVTDRLLGYLNDQDYNGNTPLHYIAAKWVKKVNPNFLILGPDVNIKNNRGLIPLQVAAMSENEDIVDRLLIHSTTIITTDLVLWAMKNKLFMFATKLMTSTKKEITGEWTRPLNAAIRAGYADCLRLILTKYADSHQDLQNALVLAAAYHNNSPNHMPLFALISNKKGVDINGRDSEYGRTALHQAVLRQNIPLIQQIKKIPEVSLQVQDKANNTPKELAIIYYGSRSPLLILLEEPEQK